MTASFDPSSFPGLSRPDADGDIALPPRLVDLVQSFPLLFFMLASDSGAFARRLEAIRLVQLGRSLPEVAAVYRLPLCLRRIRPESCVSPLPWVGWSKEAGPLLANHVPEVPSEAANWLSAVFYAGRYCNEDFALWMARQRQIFVGPALDCRSLQALVLYAWHSCQLASPLQCITVAPWSPHLGLPRALEEADAWFSRLQMLAQCGTYPIEDTWLEGGQIGGYDFVPIVTWDQLIAERVAMRNCLHTYVDKLAGGICRLFAVKSGAQSVATLELATDRSGALLIVQLKAPGNARPSPEIQAAAHAWANGQTERRRPALRHAAPNRTAARLVQLLAPYREATGTAQTNATTTMFKDQIAQLRFRLLAARGQPPGLNATRRRRAVLPLAPADGSEHQRVHAALRARLGDDVHAAWFSSLDLEGCAAGIVRATVPVRFLQRWIEAHYMPDVLAACAMVWADAEHIDLAVRPAVGVVAPAAPEIAIVGGDPVRAETGNRRVTIEEIIAALSRRFGVSRADLLSQRRHHSVVLPRQIGMYLARQLSQRGMPEIGRRFGNRDHTTVLHAVRKIDRMMDGDLHFRTVVDGLRRDLSAATVADRH